MTPGAATQARTALHKAENGFLMFLFYLRGKSRRGGGGHVLGSQVLRGVGK